jgi:hypothetical protein
MPDSAPRYLGIRAWWSKVGKDGFAVGVEVLDGRRFEERLERGLDSMPEQIKRRDELIPALLG